MADRARARFVRALRQGPRGGRQADFRPGREPGSARLSARRRFDDHVRDGRRRDPLCRQHAGGLRSHGSGGLGQDQGQGRPHPAQRPAAQRGDAAPPAGRCDHAHLAPLHPQQRCSAGEHGSRDLEPDHRRPGRQAAEAVHLGPEKPVRDRDGGPDHRMRRQRPVFLSIRRPRATSGRSARSPARTGPASGWRTCSRRRA